ncbi:MAG: hypothetical protein L6R37_004138 [Teloschistes peruensis]|nr:MAG: hypothetical protein L6R37_004138 [Teloschistes peruensis]
MALIAVAESAREVAVGFNKFLDPVPEISTEITALMSECYAISSELQKLDNAKEDQRYYHDYNYIYTDVLSIRQSLECTFDDIIRLFGALGRPGHISRRAAYHQVWREIDSHFYQESGFSLCRRLEYNRLFLKQLNSILIDGPPSIALLETIGYPESSTKADLRQPSVTLARSSAYGPDRKGASDRLNETYVKLLDM